MLIISSGTAPFKDDASRFKKPDKTPFLRVSEEKFTVCIQKYPSLLSELVQIEINSPFSKKKMRALKNDSLFTYENNGWDWVARFSLIFKSEAKTILEKIAKLYSSKEARLFFQEKAAAFVNSTSVDRPRKTLQLLPHLIVDSRKFASFPYPFTMSLINKIRRYEVTEERTTIITRLLDHYYMQFTDPKLELQKHLKEAGCAPLTECVSKDGYKDPFLNPTAPVRRWAIPLSMWNGL